MRHAYLILAHASDLVFQTLIRSLDDESNDIYVHMDVKNADYDQSLIESLPVKSHLYHVERHDCRWADYSLVEAELSLLSAATHNGEYGYYHLLSGADLPIKSQAYIHSFFSRNSGKEFVRFHSPRFLFSDRVNYYYPYLRTIGRRYKKLRHITVAIQKLLGIRRNSSVDYQKGTQWFSITDAFARYILSKREWIAQIFAGTYIPDELFVQTLLINSPYRENLYRQQFDNDLASIQRLIDWERGTPYVFRASDYQELKDSPYLFARKFDARIDIEIVHKIEQLCKENNVL